MAANRRDTAAAAIGGASYSRKSKQRAANRKYDRRHHHHDEAISQVSSSNKDLLQATDSTRNQQFPMFGYQIQSSETAGIGELYDTTKNNSSAMPSSKQQTQLAQK